MSDSGSGRETTNMDPDISQEIFSKTAEVIRAYDNAFGASVKASQAFFDLQTILPPCMRMGVITGIPPISGDATSFESSSVALSPPPLTPSTGKSPNTKLKHRKSPYTRNKSDPSPPKTPPPVDPEPSTPTLKKKPKPSTGKAKTPVMESTPEQQERDDQELLTAFQACYERRIKYNKVSQKQLANELNKLSNGTTAVVQGTMSKLIRGIAIPKDAAIVNALKKWIENENANAEQYDQLQPEEDS